MNGYHRGYSLKKKKRKVNVRKHPAEVPAYLALEAHQQAVRELALHSK